jgi:hypothetical protein
MTPAPQGAGVFVSNDRKEVIEMTDDDTGTTGARDCVMGSNSITLQMQKMKSSVLKRGASRNAENEENRNG